MKELYYLKQLINSCECGTKSPEPEDHHELCYYRLLMEKKPSSSVSSSDGVIKPCPFCGFAAADVPIFDTDDEGKHKGYAVTCMSCGSWGATTDTREEAIDAWQKRAI